jgi:hypothetical protein
MWVFVLGLACVMLAQLDTLAKWDRQLNRGWRGWLGAHRDRPDRPARPLDPLIGIAPSILDWLNRVMPDTHEYYRKKYIHFVIVVILGAVMFTLLELTR